MSTADGRFVARRPGERASGRAAQENRRGLDGGYPTEFGPLAEFVADPAVTDIFVNGRQGVWVDRGGGAVRVADLVVDEPELRALAVQLLSLGNRHIDEATPCVDARLADGIRVHAVLPPISPTGTLLSIRLPRIEYASLESLESTGFFEIIARNRVDALIQRRENLLITGASGAGKTTFLSAILSGAAPAERIVAIEETYELRVRHPHYLALESRQPNLEGAGGVGLERLVREALRMRPDRLVLGECRGAELRELLAALNTGHDGGAGTLHANALEHVPARLEALGALGGMSAVAVARQSDRYGAARDPHRHGPASRPDGHLRARSARSTLDRARLMKPREPELGSVAATAQRLAVLLAAGVPPTAAWGYLRDGDISGAVAAAASRGEAIAEAIVEATRVCTPAERDVWRGLAAAWAVATEAGAALAPTLQDFAESLRGLVQAQREIAVALAAPRATARLVLALPGVGILFGVLLGFDTLGNLFTTVPGWACVVLGSGLMLTAWRWNRRLVARAQPRELTPGLGCDLLAIALRGGGSIERARSAVAHTLDRFELSDAGDEAGVEATLALSGRAGVPAAELLRSEARERRRTALASAQSAAQALSVRLMIPLGVCVLPAFMILCVVPLLLAVLAQGPVLR